MIVVGTFHELFCVVHVMPKVQSFPFLKLDKKIIYIKIIIL